MSAVFVFDSGSDMHVFATARHASAWLEAIDVEDGEYPAAYLHDGTVVELATTGGRVVLPLTGRQDLPALEAQVAAWQSRVGRSTDVSDLLAFANETLRAGLRQRRFPDQGPPQAVDG